MCAKGAKYGPDNFEVSVVLKNRVRFFIRRNYNRYYYVAVFFAACRGPAHNAPDRLDDVYFGVPRGKEKDCVEGRNINPLGEAADIGEDAAFAFAPVLGFEPGQFFRAEGGVHRSVNVVGRYVHHLRAFGGGKLFIIDILV